MSMKKYRLLKAGETTSIKLKDEFQVCLKDWVPCSRDGRYIHEGLVGAYRRPVRKSAKRASQ